MRHWWPTICAGLRWAPPAGPRNALRRLETHYRNANVRVAVCGELINRVVPQPGRLDAPVRDTVVNVPVRGHTSTFTELSIKLVPDAHRIRLGLEARGSVASNTISSSGPATFRNTGHSTFLVRKLFVLGHQGLHVWPAIAEAENDYNYLVSLETDFDGVPLVGSLVRTIAQNQHDEIRAEARRQTERKVAVRALRPTRHRSGGPLGPGDQKAAGQPGRDAQAIGPGTCARGSVDHGRADRGASSAGQPRAIGCSHAAAAGSVG